MSKAIHEAYLLAITDERAILRKAMQDGEDIPSLASEMLESCKRTMAQGWAGDMAHYMRGSRDFWQTQVNKWSKVA
jgi:hypothetical protein